MCSAGLGRVRRTLRRSNIPNHLGAQPWGVVPVAQAQPRSACPNCQLHNRKSEPTTERTLVAAADETFRDQREFPFWNAWAGVLDEYGCTVLGSLRGPADRSGLWHVANGVLV